MPTYYHATSSENEVSIDKLGIRPSRSCPVDKRPYPWCDPEAIFISPHFLTALDFGGKPLTDRLVEETGKAKTKEEIDAVISKMPHIIVYAIDELPKNCKLEPDPFNIVSLRVKNCGCLKPSRKCHVRFVQKLPFLIQKDVEIAQESIRTPEEERVSWIMMTDGREPITETTCATQSTDTH